MAVTFDKVTLIALAVWSLLFGLFAVTNVVITWGRPLCGFAALVLGVICTIRAFR